MALLSLRNVYIVENGKRERAGASHGVSCCMGLAQEAKEASSSELDLETFKCEFSLNDLMIDV